MLESAPTSHPPAGQQFGRFLLLECIGRGGMAEVFRAVAHGVEGFQRIFVIKRIHRDKSDNPQLIEMFVNEARISALLNHPNIVHIYDFGQIEGWYFLAMEHLRGKDLLLVLRQLRAAGQVMPAALAAFVAREVAAGLDYAHRLTGPGGRGLQIVHRDVSPSNVMLVRAGGVKLLDFGIAKAEALLSLKKESLTDSLLVKGKLSYLSPEQVRNEPIDAQSDIFSLGVMFWECLTGKRLFYDKVDYKTMNNVLNRPVPAPSALRPDVPPAIDAVVLRALDRDREHRYQSAQTMADDLDHALADSRFQPRMLPLFLDELFGPDETLADSLPGVPPLPLPGDIETPIITPRPPLIAVPGLASFPPAGASADGLVPAASSNGARPAGAARARALALGLAGALIIGAFTAGLVLSNPPPLPELPPPPYARPAAARAPDPGATIARPAPAPVEAPPRAPAPVPAAAPPAAAAPAPAAPPVEPVARVSVRIESEPSGADVSDAANRPLGRTPLVTSLPRGSHSVTIILRKPGFRTTRHTLHPSGNLAALIHLRARPEPPAPPPSDRVTSPGGEERPLPPIEPPPPVIPEPR